MKTAMRDRTCLRDDLSPGYDFQPYAKYAVLKKNLPLATSRIAQPATCRSVGHVQLGAGFEIGGIKLPVIGDFVLRTPVVMNVI